MARTEARVRTSIWTDADFRAMTPDAQWAYMFLLSQPDLSHAGVLPLRVRRWAGHANGMDADALGKALAELERARFVVVDRDTEELLVRTFIRNDEVYRQPNLLRAARKSLGEVASDTLRKALSIEIERCVPLVAGVKAEGDLKALLAAMVEDLAKGSPNPSTKATENPLGDRGVTTVTTDSPYPLSPSPAPPASSANPSPPERVVLDATDATPDEARAVAALVKRELKPTRLVGMLRTMAADGDLAEWLARVRSEEPASGGPRCPTHKAELASNCRSCAADRKART